MCDIDSLDHQGPSGDQKGGGGSNNAIQRDRRIIYLQSDEDADNDDYPKADERKNERGQSPRRAFQPLEHCTDRYPADV